MTLKHAARSCAARSAGSSFLRTTPDSREGYASSSAGSLRDAERVNARFVNQEDSTRTLLE
jgi:hypothetical protein